MVAVRDRVVAATRAVDVACATSEHVFVYVIAMHVVQVPIMQVIDVIVMMKRRVSAVCTMLMTVISVVR
jgi:hypothetical protein